MAPILNRISTVILLLVLIALLGVLAMLATGVRGGPLDPPGPPGLTDSVRLPGTPISGQTTISASGNYYLTRNIAVTGAQTAITISASSVTLDLGGFTIDGDDNAGSLDVSVSMGGFENITIRNGVVSDFLIGLNVDAGTAVVVEHVTVHSNVVGMEVGSSVVSECVARSNTTGISLLANHPLIRDCLVNDNSGAGVFAASNGTIRRSDLQFNGTDLHSQSTLLVEDTNQCSDDGPGIVIIVGGFDYCP